MKWIIGIVVGVILLIAAVGSAAFNAAPMATPALIHAYESIVPQEENGPWIDVYVFDFFYWHNQFRQLTNADIAQHARWFFVPGIPAHVVDVCHVQHGKKVCKKTKIKAVPPSHLTLVQALDLHGLGADAQEAVTLEGQLSGTYQVSFAPVSEPYLRYEPINVTKLYSFLSSGGSAFSLSDLNTIIQAARAAGVNPLLLVAITGQEESFVPRSWPAAAKILNNPFNVNVSWQNYNTNLANAAQIAANSVRLKLATPPPAGEDAISWINDPRNPDGLYATDRNWADGVRAIFWSLQDQFGLVHFP